MNNNCRVVLSFSGIHPTISRFFSSLKPPTVLYNDNHLLVVNKPPGWHSVPNPKPSPKCLLSYLKDRRLGGGSKKDFLLPLHRIDQPCSGTLLFGKTSKAGSRITKLWKKKQVQKEYLVVVSSSNIANLQQMSSLMGNKWYMLQGAMQPRISRDQRSVHIKRFSSLPLGKHSRPVRIDWKIVGAKRNTDNPHCMLLIRNNEGARHVVRALLALVGNCPVEGDLRYNSEASILPDQSVALHAFRVHLDNRLQLGSLTTSDFEAPIPSTWEGYFGVKNEEVAAKNSLRIRE